MPSSSSSSSSASAVSAAVATLYIIASLLLLPLGTSALLSTPLTEVQCSSHFNRNASVRRLNGGRLRRRRFAEPSWTGGLELGQQRSCTAFLRRGSPLNGISPPSGEITDGDDDVIIDDSKSSSTSSTPLLLLTCVTLLSLISFAAATGHLPGPIIDASSHPSPSSLFLTGLPFGTPFAGCLPYSAPLMFRDIGASVFSSMAAAVFVKACTYPVARGWIEPRDSRKIVHTLSAPLFLLVWPLFSPALGARVFASVVPLLFGLRLFLAGTTTKITTTNATEGSEAELARAISRSGDAREALQGPFIYVIVLFLSTLLLWTDSPIGVVAVCTMAVGDGLADLVGRRLGKGNRWIFSESKSVAGSAAFALGSFVGNYGLLSWLIYAGAMEPIASAATPLDLAARLAIIAVVCAAVELVPLADDNWTVPVSAAVLAGYLLQ